MNKKKLFLASSSELQEDREAFEIFINRKNKDWVDRGVFLELVMWEDFLDSVSRTRLQDDYNRAIRECDIFVMLFFTKVGQYTEEEFETAFGQFQATDKPFIFTYFKDAEVSLGSANEDDLISMLAFKKKLSALGHFYTRYKNVDELTFHFDRQLNKLAANGFVEFESDASDAAAPTHQAHLSGSGAIAQGPGAAAVGAGGVMVGGDNTGDINTGTRVETGGGAYIAGSVNAGGDFVGRDKMTQGVSPGELESLFAPLLAAIAQQAPAEQRAAAVQHVDALKAELAKDTNPDDSKLAKIVDGLVTLVPGAIGTVASLFATPILQHVAGNSTRFVLDKLKGR